jgi:hypothetical protein
VRLAAYAALGLGVTVLQFAVGTKGTPAREMISLSEVAIGWHIFREGWALTAKLVLPIADGITLEKILPLQWAAGAVAAVTALFLLATGSRRAMFLVAWVALGLAPFTLWTAPIAPARYVYMAAVPFALLASWGFVTAARYIARWGATGPAPRRLAVGVAGVAAAAVIVAGGAFSAVETIDRNEAFAREAEPYRILAQGLPKELPAVPSYSRLVLYYGVWDGSVLWQDAVVQTVYRDRTLRTTNIGRDDTDSFALPALYNDVAVYYTERGFIAPARDLPFRR